MNEVIKRYIDNRIDQLRKELLENKETQRTVHVCRNYKGTGKEPTMLHRDLKCALCWGSGKEY